MKELHTGRLYWPDTLDRIRAFPVLTESIRTRVAIVGGGLSGIFCACLLAERGIETALLEGGAIAGGSTMANTGLIHLGNDIMLCELSERIGRAAAELFYRSCKEAADDIARLAAGLPVDVEFKRTGCLYYASTEQDLPRLIREHAALAACGLEAELWTADDIGRKFPFRKPGAIVTQGETLLNPLRFAVALADWAAGRGASLYERTEIVRREPLTGGRHRLHAAGGWTVDAEHVVYAIGYEPEQLRGRLLQADLNRTYVMVTGKQQSLDGWHGQWMIWETARPYLYLRTTPDGRVMAGGLDEPQPYPNSSRKSSRQTTLRLARRVGALFPMLDMTPEYEWNATFGESLDGLPFIGEDPAEPNVHYSLGYGGNGTISAMIAAGLIRDRIAEGRSRSPLADIVALNRLALRP